MTQTCHSSLAAQVENAFRPQNDDLTYSQYQLKAASLSLIKKAKRNISAY
jgi:hypothetical protein